MKCFFEIIILVGSLILFFACDDENINDSPLDNCPSGYICDTTYIDTSAYSFVYYSSKKNLDTLTALADDITCEIQENNFQCTLRKVFERCAIIYSFSTTNSNNTTDQSLKEADTLVHKEIKLVRVDTTYINYGKKRLIDYIPPYIETPEFQINEFKDAFDTVVIDYDKNNETNFFGRGSYFHGPYKITDNALPNFAGVSSYKGSYITIDHKDAPKDSVFLLEELNVSSPCYDTTYTKYPLTSKHYQSYIYAFLDEPFEKDSTVTWTAYYQDIYGVMDSIEVTTLFKMKEE